MMRVIAQNVFITLDISGCLSLRRKKKGDYEDKRMLMIVTPDEAVLPGQLHDRKTQYPFHLLVKGFPCSHDPFSFLAIQALYKH